MGRRVRLILLTNCTARYLLLYVIQLLFSTATQHPLMRTVVWANGADLAPEYLFDLMSCQAQSAA